MLKILLLSLLLVITVDDCKGTDPLLLEYSDYYYDLYYGDYEDYAPGPGDTELLINFDFIENIFLFR